MYKKSLWFQVFCGRNIVVKSTILENHVTKELERTMLPTIPLDGNDSEKEEESPEILVSPNITSYKGYQFLREI